MRQLSATRALQHSLSAAARPVTALAPFIAPSAFVCASSSQCAARLLAQASNPSTRRRFLPFFLNGQLMPPRQTVAPADAPDQPLSCLLYMHVPPYEFRAARARLFYCSSHAKAGFERFTFSAHCRHGRRPDAGLFQGPRNLSLSL